MKSFEDTLTKMLEIHKSKNQDYADPSNPLSNFDVSHYLLSLFNEDRDKTFVWPIATKLARLATLLNSGNIPNNESIEDSLVDIANYVILWKCDLERRSITVMYKTTESDEFTLAAESRCYNCKEKMMPGHLGILVAGHIIYCSQTCAKTYR